MGDLLTGENLVALLTLTSLEVVLGIDNVIFISILTSKLPPEQQAKARYVGLGAAMVMRVLLLLAINWVMGLTNAWFHLPMSNPYPAASEQGKDWEEILAVTGKDVILLVGGLFLIAKSVFEIHEKLEAAGEAHKATARKAGAAFAAVIVQIMMIDIVFSLDSVITAVGMAKEISIMIIAVMISVAVMMVFAGPISRFVENHPTMKILALSFLILIGVMLVAEGFGQHINKGYIYFAMAFALVVELVNLKLTGNKMKGPHKDTSGLSIP